MLFKAEFSEAITPIFSVTWAFRNHYYKIKQNKKSGHQIKLYSKQNKKNHILDLFCTAQCLASFNVLCEWTLKVEAGARGPTGQITLYKRPGDPNGHLVHYPALLFLI